jgi:hypothetical protein
MGNTGIIFLYLNLFVSVAAFTSFALKREKLGRGPALILLSTALLLTACAGGGGGGSTSTSTTTTTSTPGYVPLTETAFIGDEITLHWPEMNTGGSSLGVSGLSNGTTEKVAGSYWPEICLSCTPSQYAGFQYLANVGMKRAVFLMGTYDVLGSQPCEGGTAAIWDGKALDAGDPTYYYGEFIQAAQNLFPKVSLVVGTIPPLGSNHGAGCAAVVTSLNAEIKAMATKYKVPVVDFNAVLQVSNISTISTTSASDGILPNASGYAAMTTAYDAANQ